MKLKTVKNKRLRKRWIYDPEHNGCVQVRCWRMKVGPNTYYYDEESRLVDKPSFKTRLQVLENERDLTEKLQNKAVEAVNSLLKRKKMLTRAIREELDNPTNS